MSRARAETETVPQRSDAHGPMPSTTPTLQTLGWLVCYDVNRTLGVSCNGIHVRARIGSDCVNNIAC